MKLMPHDRPIQSGEFENIDPVLRKKQRNRESRTQWRKRHPEESSHLTDDEVDAIVAANRKARMGCDRRSSRATN